MPGLELEEVTVGASGETIVGPVSLALEPGDCVTVMGETGAVKSLLAQAVIGALPPGLTATGRISLGGSRVDGAARAGGAALWGRTVTLLPQEPWRALNPIMRFGSQVEETHRHVAGRSVRDARAATRADLLELDVLAAARRLPGTLSGGMVQRVAFAAAKAGGAPLVIADEPTKGLDADRVETVTARLKRVPDEGGALLTITHDLRLARRLGGDSVIPQGRSRGRDRSLGAGAFSPEIGLRRGDAGRGGRALVRDFNLLLRRSERVSIVGPSGSGKTSLLGTLAGILPPLSGRLRRGPGLPATAVQKLYQDPPAAFPNRVTLLASLRDVSRRHDVPWARVEGLLVALGVGPGLLHRRPTEVSGGELQRIALARVLMIRSAVLLADEPTSRMDPITQAAVIRLIARAAAEHGSAVVLVTHDREVAGKWGPETRTVPALHGHDVRG